LQLPIRARRLSLVEVPRRYAHGWSVTDGHCSSCSRSLGSTQPRPIRSTATTLGAQTPRQQSPALRASASPTVPARW
jgi:hypothetical protein